MGNYIARQPIFNKRLGIYGYELLHRSDYDATAFEATNGDKASSETIVNSFHKIGIDKVTGGKRAFVNFTENLLLEGVATILPSRILVVELLENILPTPEVIQACELLRYKGYTLALDDFILEEAYRPLIEVADIIKIDFLATPLYQIEVFANSMRDSNIMLLAEKLETQDLFDKAVKMGFSLFQGYFFSKPDNLKGGKTLTSLKLTCLKLITLIFEPTINFSTLADTLKHDVALSYQLLKVVNSAFFGLRYTVSNIKQALAILGMDEVKKWITLVSLVEIKEDKPDELIRLSLSRARFLELVAPLAGFGSESENLYMIGLLSLMDVIVDMPMEDVLAETHVSPAIATPLLTKTGPYGELLMMILNYEEGKWDASLAIAEKYKLPRQKLTDIYLRSLEWANNF